MAVTVSSDLSVNISEDQNMKKLTVKQELLKESFRKGEPKTMGISQVMLGFLVMCYSMPLLFDEFTELVRFGVPWWSGLTFIIAGAIALATEKKNSMQMVLVCMMFTILAAFVSVIALIFYIADFSMNPGEECQANWEQCNELHYSIMFMSKVKSFLFCLNIVQTAISSSFSVMLYKERKAVLNYMPVN